MDMETKTMLPLDRMMVGAIYKGQGRNFDIGKWTGYGFVGLRLKLGQYFEDVELHYETCTKYGTFMPFEVIAYPDTLEGALTNLGDRVADLKKAVIDAFNKDRERIRKCFRKLIGR